MKLIKKISQFRRDFRGEYKCEFCGHIHTDESLDSYDDGYYHNNVIPNMKCQKCGKSTISENGIIDKTSTKYPEGMEV